MSEALTTAMTTGFQQVQTDVTSVITTALPIGLAIMGTFLAVRLGIKFFKSVAGK